MTSKVKKATNIGFVGGSLMGQLAHLANYQGIPNCRIGALAELRPHLRSKVARHYGIPKTYESHKEMIEDPDLEAIVIVTNRPMLAPVTLDCLLAGKHVLTEKPMAASAMQARRLVEAAERSECHYVVGYMKRHDCGVRHAKKLLDELRRSGRLGEITFARFHNFMGDTYCNIDGTGNVKTAEPVSQQAGWPQAPDWLPQALIDDYAWFLNAYCHDLNLIRYLLGEPDSVKFADLRNRSGQLAVLDYCQFACILETGQFNYAHWDEVVEILFQHGRLQLELPSPMLRNISATVKLYDSRTNEEITYKNSWSWSFRRQAESFVSCLQSGLTSVANGRDALRDLEWTEAIWHAGFRDA